MFEAQQRHYQKDINIASRRLIEASHHVNSVMGSGMERRYKKGVE